MAGFKTDFKGTGNMKVFCEESNRLFSALNNVEFLMPSGYDGAEPSVRVDGERLVFDFCDALVFTLNNVQWNLTGSAAFTSYSAEVQDGQLVISVNADSVTAIGI